MDGNEWTNGWVNRLGFGSEYKEGERVGNMKDYMDDALGRWMEKDGWVVGWVVRWMDGHTEMDGW